MTKTDQLYIEVMGKEAYNRQTALHKRYCGFCFHSLPNHHPQCIRRKETKRKAKIDRS